MFKSLNRYLPSFSGCNLQWETKTAHEVDIIVEDATQVYKIVSVDRLHSVADLFL